MLRSLYLSVLVTAIVIVLTFSVLALAGFPTIDLPPSVRAGPYPTVVGGRLIPLNKPAILEIYLMLLGLVAVVTVASLIAARGKKRDN